MRVKIIKTGSKYKVNEVIEVSKNEGFGLVDSGFAIATKDMTARDYAQKPRIRRKG